MKFIVKDDGTQVVCTDEQYEQIMCILYSPASTDFENESRNESILEEAIRVVKERQSSYDKPERNLERIAALWSAYADVCLGDDSVTFTSQDVAIFNILQKIARQSWKNKRDNWVDIAGYAHVGYETNSEDEHDE